MSAEVAMVPTARATVQGARAHTHPLLHAGDDEPQVGAHLLPVRVLLLNALGEEERPGKPVTHMSIWKRTRACNNVFYYFHLLTVSVVVT